MTSFAGSPFSSPGHSDYSAAGHAINPDVPWLGIYFVVLAPVVGGLIYGPLIQLFAPEARGHGVPEVMLAVADAGRKDPTSGRCRQVARLSDLYRRRRVGGTRGPHRPDRLGAGLLDRAVAARVREPTAFARRLRHGRQVSRPPSTRPSPGSSSRWSSSSRTSPCDSFGAVVLASVTADVIGRAAFGNQAFLTLPAFHIVSNWEFGLYAILGVAGRTCRARIHPHALLDRGSPGSHVAWPRMAPSSGWWRAARTPAAGAPRALWRRLSGTPKRGRRTDSSSGCCCCCSLARCSRPV